MSSCYVIKLSSGSSLQLSKSDILNININDILSVVLCIGERKIFIYCTNLNIDIDTCIDNYKHQIEIFNTENPNNELLIDNFDIRLLRKLHTKDPDYKIHDPDNKTIIQIYNCQAKKLPTDIMLLILEYVEYKKPDLSFEIVANIIHECIGLDRAMLLELKLLYHKYSKNQFQIYESIKCICRELFGEITNNHKSGIERSINRYIVDFRILQFILRYLCPDMCIHLPWINDNCNLYNIKTTIYKIITYICPTLSKIHKDVMYFNYVLSHINNHNFGQDDNIFDVSLPL
jgi:hypothetical protein